MRRCLSRLIQFTLKCVVLCRFICCSFELITMTKTDGDENQTSNRVGFLKTKLVLVISLSRVSNNGVKGSCCSYCSFELINMKMIDENQTKSSWKTESVPSWKCLFPLNLFNAFDGSINRFVKNLNSAGNRRWTCWKEEKDFPRKDTALRFSFQHTKNAPTECPEGSR